MAEEIFQRPLLSFDMQGQSIKEVLLKSVKIEEIEALPEASENYNRVLFNKGELKYSNGEKWIGQAEMVGLGLVVKTNFNDSNIPKGQIDINGHRATLFNKIDNSDLSLMPTKTIKGNRADGDASPTDITYANFARDMRDSTLLGVTLTTLGGMYVLKQGDVEVGRFSTSSFVDTIELVQGYWSEDKMSFTEDKEGTDLAMKLIIKKELEDASVIYLDVSKLIDVYKGGTTDTINVSINLTDEGYNVFAEIKEYSIKKEHLSKELNTEIEEAISTAQIQADWNQTDATQKDFIKNKPTHLPSPADSITTEQLQAGVVTNAKLANKTINFNGQTFELGAGNQNLAPLKNTGFEVAESLPTTNNFEGRQVVYQGRTYTFHNGKYQCIADDLGGVKETREEQFTFQPTANDESVKDGLAIVKSIKGNAIVANQLIKNGDFSNDTVYWNLSTIDIQDNNDYLTLNKIAAYSILTQPITVIQNHIYLLTFTYRGKVEIYFANLSSGKVFQANDFTKVNYIITATDYNYLRFYPLNSCDLKKDVRVVDLTQMFGAGNEPTTVEEFERLYPNLPKEYNAGSLLNLNAEAIKSVGFNLFDKNTVQRGACIDPDTLEVINAPSSKESVSSFIRVIPNETYYTKNAISEYHRVSLFFDKDKKLLTSTSLPHGESINGSALSRGLITIPENVYYVRFGIYNDFLDSCVFNFSHSGYRNGEYEPYKESIVNLPPIKDYFPDGMRSAGKVRDEIVWDEGLKKYKAIQRIGSVDLGATSEIRITLAPPSDDYPYGYIHINMKNMIPHVKNSKNSLMVKYPKGVGFAIDKTHLLGGNFYDIYIIDSSYTDVESFKQSLQGQILYYELETPIETIIDDYPLIDYEVSDFGTEEIIAVESTTPIIADIQYGFNAVDEIRNHRFEIKDLKKKSNQYRQMLDTIKGHVTNIDDKVIEIDTKLEDLDTIKTNASNGNTAYGWGNHANAGYAKKTELMHQYVTPNLTGTGGVIELDEHKCGVSPMVQAYLNGTQVLCEISNDGSGNISWASNIYLTEDSLFKLIIIGNPNELTKLI